MATTYSGMNHGNFQILGKEQQDGTVLLEVRAGFSLEVHAEAAGILSKVSGKEVWWVHNGRRVSTAD
jgi:hypothetical protein